VSETVVLVVALARVEPLEASTVVVVEVVEVPETDPRSPAEAVGAMSPAATAQAIAAAVIPRYPRKRDFKVDIVPSPRDRSGVAGSGARR
jgi:hypothetical protein